MKKEIKVYIQSVGYDIEGDIDEAIGYLHQLKEDAVKGGFRTVWISNDRRQYEEGYELVAYGLRQETSAEETARKAKEAEQEAEDLENRRKQFEALKNEFGRGFKPKRMS